MKPDIHDREKQLAALEHNQRQAQARDDLQATKDQDFYARLGLSGPDAEADTPDDAFVISVYCDHWAHQDQEVGQASSYETELDHITVDADALVQHVEQYGISETPCSHPDMSPEACFRSTFPPEDRAYFEQGVHKYYSLLIHEMNGHPPTPDNYQQVADLIGVRFDHRLERHEQEHEQEGPDLCL